MEEPLEAAFMMFCLQTSESSMHNAWHWTREEVVCLGFTCGPGPIGPIPRGGFILCIGPPMLGCPSERSERKMLQSTTET